MTGKNSRAVEEDNIFLPSSDLLVQELEKEKYRSRFFRTMRSTVFGLVTVAAIAVLVAVLFLPVLHIYGQSMNGTLTLPFYVKSTADSDDGAYVYAGTTAGNGLTNEVTSPANGLIVVKGLAEGDSVAVTEKTAPAGYNKVDTTFTIPVTKTTDTTTTTNITKYIDADGNVTDTQSETAKTVTITDNRIVIGSAQVVVNKAGQELPETGGIGTTIFYVVGSVLVICAGVVMITRRRMSIN